MLVKSKRIYYHGCFLEIFSNFSEQPFCETLPASSFSKARAQREKQTKNLKFLIRFFVFRHLFPSCFSINDTPEKLANVFGSDQKHFCRKRHFLFDFLFRHQFFHRYNTFDLNTLRKELNLQRQTKNVQKT